MITQRYPALLLVTLGVGLSACAHSPEPATPALTPGSVQSTLARAVAGEIIAARYQVQIDPTAGTARVTPLRQSQQVQGIAYDLDLTAFAHPDTFQVPQVEPQPDGNVRITFTHAHPFPAADLTQPPSALNRADLGYTGRLLILADVPANQVAANTYFPNDGGVIANTNLVKDADGYLYAGDLLADDAQHTNTFPYVLLCDEVKDNRIGISNLGKSWGNYEPPRGGWQRFNMGPANDGWTGYDFVHQGQIVQNSATLDGPELASIGNVAEVALLIKWTDPRGAGGKVDRLPPLVTKVADFAYRLPFAALDASKIAFDHTTQLRLFPQQGSFTHEVELKVRDWDLAADPAATNDLSQETRVDTVPPANGGLYMVLSAPVLAAPYLEVPSIPGLGQWGIPGNEKRFKFRLWNLQGTVPAGHYAALVAAIDGEFNDQTAGDYHLGADPVTLAADPLRRIGAVTFQAIPFDVGSRFEAPTTIFSGETVVDEPQSVAVTVVNDIPVVAYSLRMGVGPSGQEVRVAVATSSAPQSGADWTTQLIHSGLDSTQPITLATNGNQVALAYLDPTGPTLYDGGNLRFAITTAFPPASVADWNDYVVMTEEPQPNGRFLSDVRLNYEGYPILAFLNHAVPGYTTSLGIAMASGSNPQDSSGWSRYTLPNSDGAYWPSELIRVAGRPLLNTSQRFYLATGDAPSNATDWFNYPSPANPAARRPHLAAIAGLPVLVVGDGENPDGMRLRIANTAFPMIDTAWGGWQSYAPGWTSPADLGQIAGASDDCLFVAAGPAHYSDDVGTGVFYPAGTDPLGASGWTSEILPGGDIYNRVATAAAFGTTASYIATVNWNGNESFSPTEILVFRGSR